MGPAGIAALTALITSGVQAGTGALESRRQSKLEKKRTALQDVLQSLNPQTAGQQPVRRGQGQGGWESHIASAMADPLVQKWMENKLTGLGEDQSTKRTNLPDASQALTGGGRFGAAGSGVPGAARRPSAASRAVAAPQLGTDLAGPGETAWAWPDGRRVTMEELRRHNGFNSAWRRVHPLPSGTRRPTGTQPYQQGGLLDPLLSRLRG